MLNILKYIFIASIGVALGSILGFYMTYWISVLIDSLSDSSGGNSILNVSLLFLFFTIPISGVLGAILAILLYNRFFK